MAIQRVIAEVGGPRAASAVGLGIHVAECLVGNAPGNAQIAFEGKRDAWEVLASAGGFVQRDSFAHRAVARRHEKEPS